MLLPLSQKVLRGLQPSLLLLRLQVPCCPSQYRSLTIMATLKQQLKPREDRGGQVELSQGEKAKEGAKTATYSVVILAGLGMLGTVLYTVFKELFSSSSGQALYDRAVSECLAHEKLVDALGEPIKAFGEESRRGRRNHIVQQQYLDPEGRKGVRLQFHLQGVRNRGTAQMDAREDESGYMKTRYIIVEVENMLRQSVVVVDNRRVPGPPPIGGVRVH